MTSLVYLGSLVCPSPGKGDVPRVRLACSECVCPVGFSNLEISCSTQHEKAE